MTPEEKRVVQAAIADHRSGCAPEACGGSRLDPCQLANAIQTLTFTCPQCNYDRHNCPGCGANVPHGDITCASCRDESTERGALLSSEQAERAQLAEQLREIGQGTLQEWMHLIDLVGMGGIPGMSRQARIGWQSDDGDCTVGWDRYSDDIGRFRITVSVQDLGPLPPVGPENDQALQVEIGPKEEIVWVPRAWRDVVTGDTVRAPGHPEAVTTVTRRLLSVQEDSAGHTWHVVPGLAGHWDDHLVQPGECWVILAASGDRPRKMDPAAPVEIALTPIEVSVIEQAMGGWENRVKVVLGTS